MIILDLHRTLDRGITQASRSTARSSEQSGPKSSALTLSCLNLVCREETAGNDPLISHMFRKCGPFGPVTRERLRVLTARSTTMGLNAKGRHVQGSLLVTDYKYQCHRMVIQSLPALCKKATKAFQLMQDRVVQAWGSSVDFTIRAVHQTHMRRSALAPQLFAAVAGVTTQLQTQNDSEGDYLVHTSMFSHVFQTYTGIGVCVYLNCLVGDQRFLFFYARCSRRNPLPPLDSNCPLHQSTFN